MFTLIDETLFHIINVSAHNAFFNFFMPVFSQVWLMWLGAIIGIVAYAIHCWRSSLEPVGRVLMLILLVGLSVGVTDVTTSTLKHSIGRERPCQEVLGSNYYVAEDQQWIVVDHHTTEADALGGSMPSSPAAACMAVAVVLSLLFYRSNPWVYLLPLSVGLSQIYVGKNYPSDIIVGWLIGVLSVIAVWWICHLIFIRFSSHRRLH
ncbi:phosphatase PAP2 family protein [uncultured Mailhella sp.]|uniref:phosphatase PAP2 family protein n=1 Tax=uncultured Mailhella sp. TaxID=1981031 RepID=UPI00262A65B5|nr:phosphatase PAP2 family protein [uncultured Mailhella sp.]